MDIAGQIAEEMDAGEKVETSLGTSVRVYPNSFGHVALLTRSKLDGGHAILTPEQVLEVVRVLAEQAVEAVRIRKEREGNR